MPAVDSMEAAVFTAVDTVAVIEADTTAGFTPDIPAALMVAEDPMPAHAALTAECTVLTAALAPLRRHVRGRGKDTVPATLPPDGISSIPLAPATRLAPQSHQSGLQHLRQSVDLASPP